MRIAALALFILLLALGGTAWAESPFKVIGEFTVKKLEQGRYQVTDGLGRSLLLLPRGQKPPQGLERHQYIYIPVRRVACITGQDASLINALGSVRTLVAVTGDPSYWRIPYVQEGLVNGRILSTGKGMTIDFEQVVKSRPEVVLTWDESMIPLAGQLGIPVIITHSERARTLEAQLRFVHFLAPLFDKHREAAAFVSRVKKKLKEVQQVVKKAETRPKVIWVDVFPRRILVEPGNSFHGQIVTLVGGDYLFDDLCGASCLEVSLERFFSSGKKADIMITYRTPMMGVTSKAKMAKLMPLIKEIKPMKQGDIYFPMPHYTQSMDHLADIIEEVASIVHPELFPNRRLKVFKKLPDK